MPYAIAKSGSGFKVRNKETGKTYSKHPQSKETAERQRRAIAVSEFGHGSKR
jgi:hypothetical protein